MKIGRFALRDKRAVSKLIQHERRDGLRKAFACGELKAMNAFAARFHVNFAAIAAASVAVSGLNNNANNNTRHHGWAGV